jgi:flavin-binding protein dodecin
MSGTSHTSEREAIYGAVGRALDSWTKIELAIEPLFSTLADTDPIRGSVAMASIVSFKARMEMCNSLVAQSQASKELRAKWRALFNKLNRKYKARNEIAHFSIIDWRNADTGVVTTCLIPYFTPGGLTRLHSQSFEKVIHAQNEVEAARLFSGLPTFKTLGMSSTQIIARSSEFDVLAAEVEAVVTDFVEHQKQAQASREQFLRQIQEMGNPTGQNPTEN